MLGKFLTAFTGLRQKPSRGLLLAIVSTVVVGTGCGRVDTGSTLAPEAVNTAALPDESSHEVVHAKTPDILAISESIAQIGFIEPQVNLEATTALDQNYAHVDSGGVIPRRLLTPALAYYHANLGRIQNKTYLSIVDFSIASSQPRLFIVNMNTGVVWALHVAHGSGSDPQDTGYATRFSNVEGSEMSSLGYYRTAETYKGEHGLSLRIDGLSATNSNVRSRDVVVHGASYVQDRNVKTGRSWGCFAVPDNEHEHVVSILQGGSIIYAAR